MHFEDICTINELKALSQRLQVAKMLRAGDSYEKIVEETGASTATISRYKALFSIWCGWFIHWLSIV